MMNKHRRSFGSKVSAALLVLLCALTLLPVLMTFAYSFFSGGEISAYLARRGSFDDTIWLEVLYAPAPFSLRQYYTVFIEDPAYLMFFCNSVMYAAAILLGQALVIPLTAYALSRFTFPGRDALFFGILVLMILPFQVTMAPNVMMLRALHLMDTPWAVILPMWFSPFYIFLLRQFMVGIPGELPEAGMIDGAGPLRCFVHIILPVSRPVLGAAAALSFADCWNMVEQPLLYLSNSEALRPLSVMFNQMSTESPEAAFAGSALYLLPTLLVYLFFQEDIVSGIQLSELK